MHWFFISQECGFFTPGGVVKGHIDPPTPPEGVSDIHRKGRIYFHCKSIGGEGGAKWRERRYRLYKSNNLCILRRLFLKGAFLSPYFSLSQICFWEKIYVVTVEERGGGVSKGTRKKYISYALVCVEILMRGACVSIREYVYKCVY